MRIYLLERLLVESKVLSDTASFRKERDKRAKISAFDREGVWTVYTWNSNGKLRGYEDDTKKDHLTISASLARYKYHIDSGFEIMGLREPSHMITISSHSNFIDTPLKTMMDIIKRLEAEEIYCVLTPTRAPISTNYKYMSPRLEEKIQVEL